MTEKSTQVSVKRWQFEYDGMVAPNNPQPDDMLYVFADDYDALAAELEDVVMTQSIKNRCHAMTASFGIHFGALADPLKKQLADQGLKMYPQPLRVLQRRMDAVIDLRIGGFLPDVAAVKCEKRILAAIRRHIEDRMKPRKSKTKHSEGSQS